MINCIIIGQVLKVNPSWDMGDVYKMAANFAAQGNLDAGYLYQYPNNIGITIVYMVLFKIASIFKITDFVTVATIFNSSIVGLSGILMYGITKRIFGNKKAIMISIILLITTPFYLYAAIYYTDTLSMFMMLAIAYTFLLAKQVKPEKKIKKICMYLLLGIITFIAMKIKITTMFIVIAYFIYAVFNGKAKDNLKYLLYTVIAFIVVMMMFNIVVNKKILYDKKLSSDLKMPVSQWISMGLKGNGGFDQEAYDFIHQYSNCDEKDKAAKGRIKEQLANYDANTFIKHINVKLKYTWTDGTYFAPEKLRREPVKQNALHELVLASGKNNKVYKYIPQVMHMSMLVFILIGAVSILKRKDFSNKNVILYILMLGFIFFLMIWENRSRYILTGVPFFMMAMLEGIEKISTKEESNV